MLSLGRYRTDKKIPQMHPSLAQVLVGMLHASWRSRETSIEAVVVAIEKTYGGRGAFIKALRLSEAARSEYEQAEHVSSRGGVSASEVFLQRAASFLEPLELPELEGTLSKELAKKMLREAHAAAYRAAYSAATAAEFKRAHALERALHQRINAAERALVPLCAQLPLQCLQFSPAASSLAAVALLGLAASMRAAFRDFQQERRGSRREPPIRSVRLAPPALGLLLWVCCAFVASDGVEPSLDDSVGAGLGRGRPLPRKVRAALFAAPLLAVALTSLLTRGDRIRLLLAITRGCGLTWLWVYCFGGGTLSMNTLCVGLIFFRGRIVAGLGRMRHAVPAESAGPKPIPATREPNTPAATAARPSPSRRVQKSPTPTRLARRAAATTSPASQGAKRAAASPSRRAVGAGRAAA